MAGDYRGLARRKGKDFLNIKIPYDTAGKKRNFAGIRRKMFEPKASFFLRCTPASFTLAIRSPGFVV